MAFWQGWLSWEKMVFVRTHRSAILRRLLSGIVEQVLACAMVPPSIPNEVRASLNDLGRRYHHWPFDDLV